MENGCALDIIKTMISMYRILLIAILFSVNAFGQPGARHFPIDPNVNSFCTSASITDASQRGAIYMLTIDLKGASLWSKAKAIYPFIGGNSTAHSYNLINTSLYQITWVGSPTHSSTGVAFNGTSQYGNTNLNPNSVFATDNSVALGYYSQTNAAATSQDMGGYAVTSSVLRIVIKYSDNNTYGEVNSAAGSTGLNLVADTRGLFTSSRTASTGYSFYQNATSLATITVTSSARPNVNLYIGAVNGNGTPNYGSKTVSYADITDGLSSTDVTLRYNIIQRYETKLGRQQ